MYYFQRRNGRHTYKMYETTDLELSNLRYICICGIQNIQLKVLKQFSNGDFIAE